MSKPTQVHTAGSQIVRLHQTATRLNLNATFVHADGLGDVAVGWHALIAGELHPLGPGADEAISSLHELARLRAH